MNNKVLSIAFALIISTAFAQADKSAESFNRSYNLEATKDYKGAIAALDAVYQATSYEFNLRLGWLQYLNGDFAKSMSYYKKAIELKPKSVEARLGLAYPTYALGNWEDLIKNYKEILTYDPMHYTVNTRLANIYFERKQYETALGFLLKLHEQYPFDYATNLLMGKIYVSMGKITEAKQAYNTCLLYYPNEIEVINALKKL